MKSVRWKFHASTIALYRKKLFCLILLAFIALAFPRLADAQTIHALLLLMDKDPSISASVQKDTERMELAIESLRTWNICYVAPKLLRSSQSEIRDSDLYNWIKSLKTSGNDTVMIYYSGHGYLDENNRHCLMFDSGDSLVRSEIISSLQAINCRLKILITDACSDMAQAPTVPVSRALVTQDSKYYRNLFLEHKGLLDITAASEGEFAWGSSSIGGYFTYSLIESFSIPPEEPQVEFRAWEDVLKDTRRKTQELFKQTTFTTGDKRRMEAKGISNQTPKAYSLPEQLPADQVVVVHQEPVIQADIPSNQEYITNPKDNSRMVLIPAGEFMMGTGAREIPSLIQWATGYDSTISSSWFEDETPRHKVYLDAFYIDVYEVTNAQYKKFMDETGHKPPQFWNDPKYNAPDQPVVGVSWDDAKTYCDWAGKRLPTEAEWEKSARGGLSGKRFPWGDEISYDFANYSGIDGKDLWECTAPVGSFSPNGYGLYDMAGNVFEWCADWYSKDYYSASSDRNPKGADSGLTRVVRGGGWNYKPNALRVAERFGSFFPQSGYRHVGFRCAK